MNQNVSNLATKANKYVDLRMAATLVALAAAAVVINKIGAPKIVKDVANKAAA